jgi:hypothetical protein
MTFCTNLTLLGHATLKSIKTGKYMETFSSTLDYDLLNVKFSYCVSAWRTKK